MPKWALAFKVKLHRNKKGVIVAGSRLSKQAIRKWVNKELNGKHYGNEMQTAELAEFNASSEMSKCLMWISGPSKHFIGPIEISPSIIPLTLDRNIIFEFKRERHTWSWRTTWPAGRCCSCWTWCRGSTSWWRRSWGSASRRTSAWPFSGASGWACSSGCHRQGCSRLREEGIRF